MSAAPPAELWCVDLAAAAPALHALEARTPRLSPDDEERAAALTDAKVRHEWRAAHIALRLLIERVAGSGWRRAPLVREPRGKPRLDGAPVTFSLAHTRGLALIGLARHGSIGVDVERTRPVRIGAARRARIIAAASELADAPLAADDETRMLQAWVRLEAYAKADGCGIGRLLTRLGILGGQSSIGGLDKPTLPPADMRDLPLGEGAYGAVAFLGAPAALPATLDVARLPDDLQTLEKLSN